MTAELDGLVLQLGVRRGTDFLARALHQQADRVVSREQTQRKLWRARHESLDASCHQQARVCGLVEHPGERLVRLLRPDVVEHEQHLAVLASHPQCYQHLITVQAAVESLVHELEVHHLLQVTQHGRLAKRQERDDVEACAHGLVEDERGGCDCLTAAAHALHRHHGSRLLFRRGARREEQLFDARENRLSHEISARQLRHLGRQRSHAC